MAADEILHEDKKFHPKMVATNLAAGKVFNASSACLSTFVVPSNDVPDGVETAIATKPWSSAGMKPDFVVRSK